MKKLMFLAILALVLSVNVVFADDVNETGLDVYVSNDGSDSFGNGTFDNPYKTINYTVEKAANNSNIYLKSGVYEASCDIDKSLSISGIGDVSIDCSAAQKTFKINNNSALFLNNIKFVNGYADLEGELLSSIVNEGELSISNSAFSNFTTLMGAIKNTNRLTVNNVSTNDLHLMSFPMAHVTILSPYGEFVTNIGECEITNSNILNSIYNNGNLYLNNSHVNLFIAGVDYITQNINSFIDRSKVTEFRVKTSTLLNVSNTFIEDSVHTFVSKDIYLYNSTFLKSDKPNYLLEFGESNLTAVSCVFNDRVRFASNSYVNVTYSTFLDSVITQYYSTHYLNHNWWGDNKGPKIYKNEYSTVYADDWIVMTFFSESDMIIVDFTKYTNGNNINSLESPWLINPLFVSLDAESGHFYNKTGYLKNGIFKTKLLENNANTMVYATVNAQSLRLAIGEGLTDYEWYVSNDEGNDYFCDGSFNNPFKTLKKAVSSAFSGNTIYVREGVYTLSWNANIQISKNLTFIGLGNAVLSRPNNRNIFIVDAKGELNINNLSFNTYTKDGYYNAIIRLTGGNLNIKNSRFYDIIYNRGVILCENQYVNVKLDNVTFDKITGAAIYGNLSNLKINNSKFINGKNSPYDEGSYVCVKSNVYIYNSLFENSTQSMISINKKGYYQPTPVDVYVSNTSFLNNNWQKKEFFGLEIGVGRYFSGRYSVVEGCIFVNNTGHLIFANEIKGCVFINNSAINFNEEFGQGTIANTYPNSLIEANNLINNSYFEGNSYISKSYEDKVITSPNVYYSTFINNIAAYGGALNEAREIHYCVFVNNTGIYGGDDVFVYNGNLNASGNWWGSNQKPDANRVQVFLGNLTIDNWVVMSLDYKDNQIIASLNTILDNNRNFHSFDNVLPARNVVFTSQGGKLIPESTALINNLAEAALVKNTTLDFDVYGQIDNQVMSLTVYNNSTRLIVKNQTFYGKDNLFNISLINVNGHQISNQELNIVILKDSVVVESYTLNTDSSGQTSININYPIGSYEIKVTYLGNGYFAGTSQTALISVSDIETRLSSFNYTYWGKNNKFYAILTDKNGRGILNENLTLKIYDLAGKLISTANVKTGNGGRADVLLSLDVARYRLVWEYSGNEWYSKSSSESFVEIKPINTTITLPSKTIYGKGNDFEITFKDSYGSLISDEVITLKISNATDSNTYNLKTDKGIASININLLPGVYNLEATYNGDDVYGPATAKATLTIKPVFVTLDFNSHPELPLNGVFTVILKDMYGKKVSGESLTLELYDNGILNTYTAVTDGAGEANFKIVECEGKYFGIINYDGNTWYGSTTGAATITINPNVEINNVYIKGNDYVAYYGENNYYIIDFNDTTAYTLEDKIINVVISSKDWSKSFEVPSNIFGKARLQITLEPGQYSIAYKYENKYYNIHADGKNSIVIFKMPTTLTASKMVVNIAQIRNLEVKLTNRNGGALANQIVNVNVDGVDYNVTTNANGIGRLLIDLNLGLHNVSYSFDGDNYESSQVNVSVLVVDGNKTQTNIEADDIETREGENTLFNASLTDVVGRPLVSSEMLLSIRDLNGNVVENITNHTNEAGLVQFSFKLNHGQYSADLSYNGNEINLESYKTAKIHVKAKVNITETLIYGNDCEIINGDALTSYFVVLTTINGEFLSNKTIEFKIKNQNYSVLTNEFGRAYLNVPFSPGAYEVTATFDGEENLTKASIVNYVKVYKNVVNIYSQDVVKSFNNATHYYVALADANYNPLSGKTVRFYVNDMVYEDVTDSEGFAVFEIWLNPGDYEITAVYRGEYEDEYVAVKNNITVLTTILSDSFEKIWEGRTEIIASFLDTKDNVLKDTTVYFIYNNKIYSIKTDNYGAIILDLDLKSGTHSFTFVNPNTFENKTINVKIKSTINAIDLSKYYKGSSKFTATFTDKYGRLLKNQKVKFTINKKTYTLKTDKNGKASLKINLKPGTYSIVSYNIKTGEKVTNTVKVKKTIITKNKVIKSSKRTNFKIKVVNSKGKIIKKAKVKVSVNKKSYILKTNKKGIATLNIKLKIGKYRVTSSYGGLKVKNTIKVVK